MNIALQIDFKKSIGHMNETVIQCRETFVVVFFYC